MVVERNSRNDNKNKKMRENKQMKPASRRKERERKGRTRENRNNTQHAMIKCLSADFGGKLERPCSMHSDEEGAQELSKLKQIPKL